MQQMMAGNPSWWSMHPPPSQYVQLGSSSSSSSLPLNSLADNQDHHQLPQSWSQLLLEGDEDRFGRPSEEHFEPKKFDQNWEEDQQILNHQSSRINHHVDVIKQELSQNSNLFGTHGELEEFQTPTAAAVWSQVMPVNNSPRSCVTTSTTNLLDFSYTTDSEVNNQQQQQQHSSECNSTATGGVCKKPRVQPSSSQPPLKVRKEKLGDRITALHQLVSPFGKTDTASVLLEAIGYIRFLQGQIEALSSPYLGTPPSANMRNQQSVQGDHINCVFPEDPGQLLNDTCLKRKGAPNQDNNQEPKDLRSRGLCLVPVSCTQQVGSENGADYWAPAALGGGF